MEQRNEASRGTIVVLFLKSRQEIEPSSIVKGSHCFGKVSIVFILREQYFLVTLLESVKRLILVVCPLERISSVITYLDILIACRPEEGLHDVVPVGVPHVSDLSVSAFVAAAVRCAKPLVNEHLILLLEISYFL